MQGRSLWPLLTGGAPSRRHRDDIYCEHYGTIHRQPGQPTAYATMLRTETHKLVALHGMEPGELYDLRADPSETRNLWADPGSDRLKLRIVPTPLRSDGLHGRSAARARGELLAPATPSRASPPLRRARDGRHMNPYASERRDAG